MATERIAVTFQDLAKASQIVASCASDYDRAISDIKSEVEKLKNKWQGVDNAEFTRKIEAFEGDLARMKDIISSYSTHIDTAKAAYNTTQQEVKDKASSLGKIF